MFQFYALEATQTRDSWMGLKALTINSQFYTPFSASWKSYQEASKWLNEHGNFWKNRGIKLKLIESDENNDRI